MKFSIGQFVQVKPGDEFLKHLEGIRLTVTGGSKTWSGEVIDCVVVAPDGFKHCIIADYLEPYTGEAK